MEHSLAAWLIWAVVGFLLFRSYLEVGSQGGYAGRWVLLVYAIGPLVVFATLILRFGVTRIRFSRLDSIFLVLSGLSGVYLWSFHEGLLPLHVNMAIDLFGGCLVAANAWRSPHVEGPAAWSLFAVGSCLNLWAIDRWNYSTAVYPVMLAVMCASILVVVISRRGQGAERSWLVHE